MNDALLPPTLDHAYVTPGVVELALTVTLVIVHVNGPLFVADTFGTPAF